MNIKQAALALALFTCTLAAQAQVKRSVHHSSSSAASVARGKIVYTKICAACHMAQGNGVPNMNPPLIKTSYVLGDKTKLITIVLNGFNEDVAINGQTYSNNMTPHSDLSDMEIADVLTYVRKSFGNTAGAVTAAEVKKVRAANTAK